MIRRSFFAVLLAPLVAPLVGRMKQSPKPIVFGRVRNLPPSVLNATRWYSINGNQVLLDRDGDLVARSNDGVTWTGRA